jgi:hypothetical protein
MQLVSVNKKKASGKLVEFIYFRGYLTTQFDQSIAIMKSKLVLITALLASAVAPTFGQTAIAMATPTATERFAIEADGNRDFQPDVAPAKNQLEDPAGGTWTATGSLATKREFHTATLLPSGKVLVAGIH